MIKPILTIIFLQYMGLCVFSLIISLTVIVIIRVLDLIIIIKSEVFVICHYLGLGHETMVCAVCLPIFQLDLSFIIKHTSCE